MDENMRSRLAESVRSFHIPRLGEIPDVGLYLEQVTRYVNQSITGCGLSPITASMVSNYVKQKIIPGPEKKAYGAESIAYLIFVSCIKSVGKDKTDEKLLLRSALLSVTHKLYLDAYLRLLREEGAVRQEKTQ